MAFYFRWDHRHDLLLWVFVKSCGSFLCFSDRRKDAGEDFQPQVLFVLQSIRPALDDANLVVHAFNETERHLVLHLTERSNPIPMTLNHCCKLLVRREPLPLETGRPVLEEFARPCLAFVTPQLAKRLFEQVRRVQPFVGGQQFLQGLPAIQRQVLPTGQ